MHLAKMPTNMNPTSKFGTCRYQFVSLLTRWASHYRTRLNFSKKGNLRDHLRSGKSIHLTLSLYQVTKKDILKLGDVLCFCLEFRKIRRRGRNSLFIEAMLLFQLAQAFFLFFKDKKIIFCMEFLKIICLGEFCFLSNVVTKAQAFFLSPQTFSFASITSLFFNIVLPGS